MKMNKVLLVLLLIVAAASKTQAQDQEWGGTVFLSQYRGDLDQSPWKGRGLRPGIGGLYRYYFNPHLDIKGALNFGYLAAYDRKNNDINSSNHNESEKAFRTLSFYTHFFELSAQLEYNFMNYVPGNARYGFTPYITAGVELFHFAPRARLNDGTSEKVYKLKQYQSEVGKTYSNFQFGIPLGVGFKKSVGPDKMWNLGFEIGYRLMFTDYIDDVSGQAPTTFPSAEAEMVALRGKGGIGPGNFRGNPNNNDSYFVVGLSLSKTFRKFKCY